MNKNNDLDSLSAKLPPCDPALFPHRHHIIQVYESEFAFMESLECFVTCGLRAGEGVVLFATPRHLQDLQIRLHSSQLQLDRASWQDRYIPVVANEALGRFMVRGLPHPRKFRKVVGDYLDRAGSGGRGVRVFSEMAGLMMEQGEIQATLRVEQLWNEACREREVTLLCACPSACLPVDAPAVLQDLCGAHDWILDGHAAAPVGRLASSQPFPSRGSKSAKAWSIPGTHHSATGTRWVLRPAH